MWYPIKFKSSFYATFNGNPSIFVKSTRLVLIDLFMLNYFLFIKHVPDNIDIRPYFEFGQNLARFIRVVAKKQTIYPHQTEPGKSVSYKLYSLQSAEIKTESTLHSVNTPKQYFISFLTAFSMASNLFSINCKAQDGRIHDLSILYPLPSMFKFSCRIQNT